MRVAIDTLTAEMLQFAFVLASAKDAGHRQAGDSPQDRQYVLNIHGLYNVSFCRNDIICIDGRRPE